MISRNKKEYYDLYLEVPDRGDDSSVAQVLFVLLAIRDHLLLLHLLQAHLGQHEHKILHLINFKLTLANSLGQAQTFNIFFYCFQSKHASKNISKQVSPCPRLQGGRYQFLQAGGRREPGKSQYDQFS